jgi:hypothetical protein
VGPPGAPALRHTVRLAVVCVLVVLLLVVVVVFPRPLVAHLKAILLLAQELPQSPVKPLSVLTTPPVHVQRRMQSTYGPVVADVFLPTLRFGTAGPGSRPAIVLAMGVKTSDHDRPILLHLADTLARLGFVVLWPRSEALDRGEALPEEPATFVAGVRLLGDVELVDPERISLLGFSVGASSALIAASDPAVADAVHAVISFGGYHEVLGYVVSLASRTMVVDDQTVPWQPEVDAIGHMRLILEAKEATGVLRVFDAATRDEAEQLMRLAPTGELAELRRFSPAERLDNVRARVFVLHDRGDRFVPYIESVSLHDALPTGRADAFLLTSIFEHAQFKEGVSWGLVADLASLYAFVVRAVDYLDR